jgi:hypothetical protein
MIQRCIQSWRPIALDPFKAICGYVTSRVCLTPEVSVNPNPAQTTAAKDIQSALEYSNLRILRVVKHFNDPKHFKFLDGGKQ